MPRIEKLMTDLFIILLRNTGFKDDVDRLIGKIIHDYLNSQDCKQKFETLIVEQVLQNEETIRPGMFKLLKDYLLGDARVHLTKDGTSILMNTIKIRGVERSALDSMVTAT